MAEFVRDRESNYAVQDNDLMSAGDRDNNTRIYYTHSMAIVILMSDETKLSDGLLALTTDDPL